MLRFEALDISHRRRAAGESVGELARVGCFGRRKTGVREVQTCCPDSGVRRGVRRRNGRAGQAVCALQISRDSGGEGLPCGLEYVPNWFAIRPVCEPRSQYVIACVVPDE